jgi:hypothetical protein
LQSEHCTIFPSSRSLKQLGHKGYIPLDLPQILHVLDAIVFSSRNYKKCALSALLSHNRTTTVHTEKDTLSAESKCGGKRLELCDTVNIPNFNTISNKNSNGNNRMLPLSSRVSPDFSKLFF